MMAEAKLRRMTGRAAQVFGRCSGRTGDGLIPKAGGDPARWSGGLGALRGAAAEQQRRRRGDSLELWTILAGRR